MRKMGWRTTIFLFPVIVLVAIAVLVGGGLYVSNKIREEALEPDHNGTQSDLKVAHLARDRVTLRVTPRRKKDDWRKGGIWGMQAAGSSLEGGSHSTELETWLRSVLFLLNVLFWCLRKNGPSSPRDNSLEEKPLSATQKDKLRDSALKCPECRRRLSPAITVCVCGHCITDKVQEKAPDQKQASQEFELVSPRSAWRPSGPSWCWPCSNAEELSAFAASYYRRENPESGKEDQLANALRFAASNFEAPDPHAHSLSVYFFARVASLDTSVLFRFEKLLEKCSGYGRDYVSTVISLAKCEGTQELTLEDSFPTHFDLLETPVQGCEDLDYLWTEFFVTGNQEAVAQILEVTKWPDRVRNKLNLWLQKPASNLFQKWKKEYVIWRLNRIVGISCGPFNINTGGDLDRLLFALADAEGAPGGAGAADRPWRRISPSFVSRRRPDGGTGTSVGLRRGTQLMSSMHRDLIVCFPATRKSCEHRRSPNPKGERI